MPTGKFIVIEGSDGSGKSTQFNLLFDYMKQQNKNVTCYKFPQYDKPSSYFSVTYLNGGYGPAQELGAYKPSLFYALDRFDAAQAIRQDIDEGKIVLCDRYMGSNMAHQGQKIEDSLERKKYFEWIYDLEFTILGIPKPDLNIVLMVPAEVAQKRMSSREKRGYTKKSHDIHEEDLDHLRRAVATYSELCSLYPDIFTAVNGVDKNGNQRTVDDIQSEIHHIIQAA